MTIFSPAGNPLQVPVWKTAGQFDALSLQYLSVSVESTSGELTQPLIDTTSGYLELVGVVIQNVPLANVSLITPNLNSGHFYIAGSCHFIGITKTIGNGAVLEATLTAGQSLTLSGVSFTNCTVQAGNGGAFSVVLNTGSSFTLGSDIQSSSSKEHAYFTNCTANNSTILKHPHQNSFITDTQVSAGGAFHICVLTVPESFFLRNVHFNGSFAARTGTHVYVESYDTTFANNASNWKYLISGLKTSDNEFVVDDLSDPTSPQRHQMSEYADRLSSSSHHSYAWIAAPIAVFVLAIVAAIVVIICCCRCRKRSQYQKFDEKKHSVNSDMMEEDKKTIVESTEVPPQYDN